MADNTSQAQLVELAKKRKDQAAVQAILLSIHEAQSQARMHLGVVQSSAGSLASAVELKEGYWVGHDQSPLVETATKAAIALARISTLLVTLASALSALGEQIEY
jgi:DNA topoisomerase VI subunit A